MKGKLKFKQRIIPMFLAIILFTQALSLTTASAATTMRGSGKIDNPYIITNSAQLAEMANYLSSYFRIEPADGSKTLNISSNWKAIGTSAAPFTGTLYGNGVTIKGLTISSTASYQGLFGYTNGAVIENLTLADGSVVTTPTTSTTTDTYTGSFVGYAKGTLTLTNCHSSLNVTAKKYTGGLVGYGNDANITNCTYSGNIAGTSCVGGIIGKAAKSTTPNSTQITKCSTSGTITVNSAYKLPNTTSYFGGIAGQFIGTISECFTTGDVTGGNQVGGIAGNIYHVNNIGAIILNCYSTGDITSTINTQGLNNHTGGIVGNVYNDSIYHVIKNCYSTGKIYSTTSLLTGGIIGYNGSSTKVNTVTGCYALNSQIRQKGAASTIGRVAGGTDSGCTNNYAISTMLVYYDNGTKMITFTGSKNGTTITPEAAKTQAAYPTWDFETVWEMSDSYPNYPVLQWSSIPIPVLDKVVITPAMAQVPVGESIDLEAILSNPDDRIISWTSSDESVATVNGNGEKGKVTGISLGEVTITATTVKGAQAECNINVIPPRDDEIIASIGMEIGESCRLIGLLTDLTKTDSSSITWTSSNEQAVSVDNNGKVTALDLGLSKITAHPVYGLPSFIYVLVEEAPPVMAEEIIIGSTDHEIVDGCITIYDMGRCQLTATVLPVNAADKSVTWSSDNTDVAYVNTVTGRITSTGVGNATIKAETSNGVAATVFVTVLETIADVTIYQTGDVILDIGETANFTAAVTPESAASELIWYSSNPNVAVIDGSGKVTAITEGETIITASAGGVTSSPVIVKVLKNTPVLLADWNTIEETSAPLYATLGEQMHKAYLTGVNINEFTVANKTTISATGWNNNTDPENNPKAFMAVIPAAGYNKFQLKFDHRCLDNSPNDFVLQYSTDGEIWTDIQAYIVKESGVAAAFISKEFNFELAEKNSHENLYIRWKSLSTLTYAGKIMNDNTLSGLRKVIINGQR